MNIVDSYIGLTPYFKFWVNLFERDLRILQIQDTPKNTNKLVIIAVPNDPGIELLANSHAQAEIIYLSPAPLLTETAKTYITRKQLKNIHTVGLDEVSTEIRHNTVDCIYFNCYFDFCEAGDIARSVALAAAILKKGGMLFSTHMAVPQRLVEKLWKQTFSLFSGCSRGCHPVKLNKQLSKYFEMKKRKRVSKFGFPIEYLAAEKR